MILRDLAADTFAARLAREGLALRVPPVVARIRSDIEGLATALRLLYGDYQLADASGFADFHVAVEHPRNLRRWIAPQAIFRHDAFQPFAAMPEGHAFPLLEWGLNWTIANQCHQFLTIHAAVIDRDGAAMIMPAPPGSGKSTLCAGLALRGWRLLSDELAMFNPDDASLTAAPRPISLKNASIEVIRCFAPDAVIGPISHDTHKGSVAHVKVPTESVRAADRRSRPAWVVFPQYRSGATASLEPYSKAKTLVRLADNSFNYALFGKKGFELLTRVVDAVDCYEFVYGDLDDAVRTFEALPVPVPRSDAVA